MVGCASQPKKQAPVVTALRIEGNAHLSSGQIEKKILTAKTGWWPFATKQYFDPVAWESDLKRIVRLYAARGYYQARIANHAEVPGPHDSVKLSVQVDEGQVTRVAAIDVRGLEGLPPGDRDAALKGLSLRLGQPFREGEWEATKKGIADRLRDRGYFRVTTEGQAQVDVDTHQASATILVRPGALYHFGAIELHQAPGSVIPPAFVWEQVRLAIPDGTPYNGDALEEAQRRVFGMGVFGLVKVAAGTPDDATDTIPVSVTTREAPFRTLRLGGGVTVDQIHNEARLIGDWTNRDFYGGMRKLSLHAEAGWAFIPNFYDVATNNQAVGTKNGPVADFGISFEQPRLFGRPSLREQSSIDLSRTLEQTYDNLGGRFGTGVVWQPRARLSIFPAYRLEADYLNGAPVSSAATAPLALGCQTTSGSCLVFVSYLEEILTWDRRDKPLEPRRGFYTSLSLQEGGGPLGGDFDYFRILPDIRGYISVLDGQALTFAARLRVGELWTYSGNPEDSAVTTRFYAGGAVSMRGFSERRLSPLLEAPVPGTNGLYETVPIGGNGMIDGSFEVRYSLTDSLRVASFVDFGQVTTGPVTFRDVPGVLWAVGIGLRYLTSVGPIRVDIARRLPFGTLPPLYAADPYTGAIVQQQSYPVDWGCFGLFSSHPNTPVTDGACVFQFSIGEAF